MLACGFCKNSATRRTSGSAQGSGGLSKLF